MNLPNRFLMVMPNEICWRICFMDVWVDTCIMYGSDPFANFFNRPYSEDTIYNPKKDINIVDRHMALCTILTFLRFNAESLYMGTRPLTSDVMDFFINERFHIVEEFFSSSDGVLDDLIEGEEIVRVDEGCAYYYRDQYGNTVDVQFGILEEQADFISLFLYNINKRFATSFPEITNYMFQYHRMGYEVSVVGYNDGFEAVPINPNLSNKTLDNLTRIRFNDMVYDLIMEVTCNTIVQY